LGPRTPHFNGGGVRTLRQRVAGGGGAEERWLPHFYPRATVTMKQAILLFLNDEWSYCDFAAVIINMFSRQ
jgi:hypothetical protein